MRKRINGVSKGGMAETENCDLLHSSSASMCKGQTRHYRSMQSKVVGQPQTRVSKAELAFAQASFLLPLAGGIYGAFSEVKLMSSIQYPSQALGRAGVCVWGLPGTAEK